jgi:nucleoside-diphosphate-sugar epimerase
MLSAGVTDLALQYRQPPKEAPLAALRQRFPRASVQTGIANLLAKTALPELVQGVNCLVHVAAGTKGAAADMFLNTVVATRNLLDAAVAAGVKRVVFISSFSVYKSEQLPRHALLAEQTPLEPVGTDKGVYGYVKTQQEHLVREYQRKHGFELVVLRPGVIYGPGGGAFSPRVGLPALGWFFSLGGGSQLPLTYVENCADAIARAALHAPPGSAFNVVDDELPSCAEYLRQYRRDVRKLRVLRVPYWAFLLGARWLSQYSRRSGGQLPGVFTPYIVRSMYRPLRYGNAALKAIGWKQRVPTPKAMSTTFAHLRANLGSTGS